MLVYVFYCDHCSTQFNRTTAGAPPAWITVETSDRIQHFCSRACYKAS